MTSPDVTTSLPGKAHLDAAVLRVQEAQHTWSGLTAKKRAELLGSVRRRVVDQQHVLIDTISRETAKPVAEIATQEVTAALGLLRFCERHYPAWLRGHRFRYLRPGFWTKTNAIVYDPIGVIAIIGPSNFPFSLMMMQAGAALLCGNGVILKPSERCPQTAQHLRHIFATSALPDHIVEVVEGGAATAHYLIAHPSVGKVLFTGASETGMHIAERCGRYFKPCTLELGGEGIAIVCDDADLTLTARGLLWSALTANGRSCIGTRRVLTLPGIHTALIEALAETYQALHLGPPQAPTTEVSENYPLHLEILPTNTERINSKGNAPGGPVLRVEKVASLDEAVKAINASPYGLSASVWCRHAPTARAVAQCLRVGMVWVNDASAALPQFPWGGLRRSGWGRLFAREALPELTHLKVISHDHRRTARPKFWWFPYSQRHFDLTLTLNALLFGEKSKTTLRAFWTAVWRYIVHRP